MNFARPFILRPVATTLLAIAIFLVGAVAYRFLPVASLPTVELPTIFVSATRAGADPTTMASTVAAPLERRLAEIAGVTELTSTNSVGTTRIAIQFDIRRSIESAARDVQAAINAAISDLPSDLASTPVFRKANPAAAPVLILALTSHTLSPSAVYDAADSVIAQRISQVDGVADVTVSGAEQPAIRIRAKPGQLALMGMSLEEVRAAIAAANLVGPIGVFDGNRQAVVIETNDQLRTVDAYKNVVVRTVNGTSVKVGDVATVELGTRSSRTAAWYNGKPAILLIITKNAEANVIETVDRVREMLPEIKKWVPADIDISILSDRTGTIRASVGEMQFTLAMAVALVMMVVFLFLRRATATLAAGVTVPLSLAGTCALMWLAGFTIDNLSLMALAVSVGFVVDDAIVTIENIDRKIEAGMPPIEAAIEGGRQIGFTVLSISVSLVAAFIPLLFMGGVVGRFFREFSLTLTFAILISTFVSLSVTPMISGHLTRHKKEARKPSGLAAAFEDSLDAVVNFYSRTLAASLRRLPVVLVVFAATIGLTGYLYKNVAKDYFPLDDTGLIFGGTEASPDISFEAMVALQAEASKLIETDPAVAGVGSSLGTAGFSASVNQGRFFISLKPLAERNNESSLQVINRLRGKLARIPGVRTFLVPSQDLRVGARSSRSAYQFTLWSPDLDELQQWVQRAIEAARAVPELIDVNSDREQGGLEARVVIDRLAASRLGIGVQQINDALNNAFSERQITTIYTQRNQYKVILEVDPKYRRDPSDLERVYVTGRDGAAVPLSSVAKIVRGIAPLVINHQGQFPAVTISYNLAPGVSLEEGQKALFDAMAALKMPGSIRAEVAGDAKSFAQSAGAQPLLILAALVAVYIVLGVLYESLLHPLTIISTLPSAGLGALLALMVSGTPLSIFAFIGIILLIGIVKKNGIMMVDFALEAERTRGLSPQQAIHEACVVRFRPILMTTMAALLGAVPLVIALGPGAELRRPLGITVVGGLLVSQILTLYTTPAIYLLLERMRSRWFKHRTEEARAAHQRGAMPAE